MACFQFRRFSIRAAVALAAICSLWFDSPHAVAQNRDVSGGSTDSRAERRIALVVGNGAYKDAPLVNSVNDAQDMAAILKQLGFTVVLRQNADQKQMKQAIREFGAEIKRGGVGLFYFAGHGVQSNGRNYLIPVGANIETEAELEDESVDAQLLLSFMDQARNSVNIVILDACRNNPYARSFRAASRGLAPLDAAKGTFIAFATAPGSVASDGAGGRNGTYTKYLLENLKHPESGVESVFKRVRRAVYQETGGRQVPWESSSLLGDFFFGPKASGGSLPSVAVQKPEIDPAMFELALWNEIKERARPEEYRAYLEQYPNGRFSRLARAHLSEATAAPVQVSTAPARGLLGTWNGKYGYNEVRRSPVPFKLTITAVEGGTFSGLISEPATFGDGTSRFLFARIHGRVEGTVVSFIKNYDGTGGQTHSVNYQGTLDPGTSAIRGGWTINRAGQISATGPFEASQN